MSGEVGELLERVAEGDVTEEELEDSPLVDSAEKLSRDEATERLGRTIEEDPDLEVISAGNHWLLPKIAEALNTRYGKIEQIVEDYGLPTAVLEIPENQNPAVDEVDKAYRQIYEEIEDSKLLLQGQEYIAEHQEELGDIGFEFIDDWHQEDSDYRWLLTIGKEIGTTYQMVKEDEGWTYEEISE